MGCCFDAVRRLAYSLRNSEIFSFTENVSYICSTMDIWLHGRRRISLVWSGMCEFLIVTIIFYPFPFKCLVYNNSIFVSIQDDFQTNKPHFGQCLLWMHVVQNGWNRLPTSRRTNNNNILFEKNFLEMLSLCLSRPFSKPFTFPSIFERPFFRIWYTDF